MRILRRSLSVSLMLGLLLSSHHAQAKPAAGAAARDNPPASTPAKAPGEREFAGCLKVPGHRRVKVELKPQIELSELIGWISSMTCKKFILPAALRSQTVTLISPTPITANEAYRAFLSSLEVLGLTVVASGGYLKVVQSNWAVQSAIPTYRDEERRRLPDSDAPVTQILHLREASTDQVLAVLHKLKSRSGDVTSYAPTNTLIITDHAANVRRMVAIVEQLDVGGSQAEIWLVRPKHADVGELAKVLTELFAPSAGAAPPPLRLVEGERTPSIPSSAGARVAAARFLADVGSGSLIVVASEAVYQRALAVARVLDRDEDGARPQAWVYPLKHGDAEGLATAIGNLGADGARRAGGRGPASGGGAAGLFEGPVRVNAEKSRNALVIVASMRDYLQVRRVIQELDQPRRQVYVEAYVLEIGLDKDRNLGFAFHGGDKVGSSLVVGGVSSDLNSVLLTPTSLMGLAVGLRGPTIEGSGQMLGTMPDGKSMPDISAFGVVFQAMQMSNQVNMISSPHLLTMENEEAEIVVGRKVPMRGAAPPLQAAPGAQQQSYFMMPTPVDRVDVGVRLKLTPTIGDGDTVRLKIKQEVSNVDKDDVGGGLGPSTSQKQLSTMVVVRDQHTIVIGGLLSDEVLTTESKVPLLGDIPLLGFFFKRQGKKVMKRNLLVVITPYIVKDQADLRRVFKRKLEEREEFLRRYGALAQRENLEKIDYGSKRGLLAEIDRVAHETQAEAALAREAGARRALQAERVELPAAKQPAPSTDPGGP